MRVVRASAPLDFVDFFLNFQTLEVVELGLVRLELREELVVAGVLFKHHHATSPVTNSKELSSLIEFDSRDNIHCPPDPQLACSRTSSCRGCSQVHLQADVPLLTIRYFLKRVFLPKELREPPVWREPSHQARKEYRFMPFPYSNFSKSLNI